LPPVTGYGGGLPIKVLCYTSLWWVDPREFLIMNQQYIFLLPSWSLVARPSSRSCRTGSVINGTERSRDPTHAIRDQIPEVTDQSISQYLNSLYALMPAKSDKAPGSLLSFRNDALYVVWMQWTKFHCRRK
jgi:hypothetical protein